MFEVYKCIQVYNNQKHLTGCTEKNYLCAKLPLFSNSITYYVGTTIKIINNIMANTAANAAAQSSYNFFIASTTSL